ncbi:hypothetical protein LTR17_002528 [Elasticomyces elasticus]|nr:hypothetical protein LTR17_002528 [Elasticomyces elasticus]
MAEPHSSEMSLAEVQALIDTYDTLDRERCKEAMVKVAMACNAYGATAIEAANELQDLSMERGHTLFDLSKAERKLIEQNAKLILNQKVCSAASYARRKIERLAAIRRMCPELENNNSLPKCPKPLKELHDLIERHGYQFACSFLRDAMYRRFQALSGNGRNKRETFARPNARDFTWAVKQSQLDDRPSADTPAVLFEQRDGLPHFVRDRPCDLRKLLGKALLEQAAKPAVGAPNTSNSGTAQPASAGSSRRAVDTTAHEHNGGGNETPPPVIKTKTRKQPARKVNAPLAQTVKPARKGRETDDWYTIGGRKPFKRPALQSDSMPSPKRQAAHSPSATPQNQPRYTHPRVPTASPTAPVIAPPQLLVTESMLPRQRQTSHTLSLSPQHQHSRSRAPTPPSMMPEVAEPKIRHYYSKATSSASPASLSVKEEPAEADEAVLDGHINAHAEYRRLSEEIRPASTGTLQQTPALQESSVEATHRNVAESLRPSAPGVTLRNNERLSWKDAFRQTLNIWTR